MVEALRARKTAVQSISAASNGGRDSQGAVDAYVSRRRAIRRRHSAVNQGRGGRVVARHICKDWAEVKDKAKSLEHIIRKCDPPTPAMPLMATGATVPGLYSHIMHLVDKEEGEIPSLFKGAKPKQTRSRGKPKGKPQEQRQNPPKAQEADETYTYDSPNNYYHNDNYTATSQNPGRRPFNDQGSNQQFRGFTQ